MYSSAIHIWSIAGKTVKAFATKSGLIDSAVATLSGVFSYPPLKTGAGAIGGYTLVAGEDGQVQNGVARSYTGPTAHATYTSDYTTTDNATGLVWKTCSQGLSGATCASGTAVLPTWANAELDATNGCKSLNTANSGSGYAGRTNWRLPTVQELSTLVDAGKTTAPKIDAAFPATQSANYWSSTTSATGTGNALYVTFNGNVANVNTATKGTSSYVRCVSGP